MSAQTRATDPTEKDRADALDYGVPVALMVAARLARAAYGAAWRAQCAYTERPDHDVRSEEFGQLHDAYVAAQAASDKADHAIVEAMPQ